MAACGKSAHDTFLQVGPEIPVQVLEADDAARMEAAKAAAPYMHPRLQAVAFSGDVNHKTHEQRLIELDALGSETDAFADEVFDAQGETQINRQKEVLGVADQPRRGNGADDPTAAEESGDGLADLAGLATVAGLADDAGQVD